MPSEETIIRAIPAVRLFSTEGGWLRRLWTGGDGGIGTLVLTGRRLLWLKARRGGEQFSGGPSVTGLEQADALLRAQGGRGVGLDEITFVSAAPGRPAAFCVEARPWPTPLTFHFEAPDWAHAVPQFMEAMRTTAARLAGFEVPASPVEPFLRELGLPAHYGLPAVTEQALLITWCRATLGFAYRTLKEGRAELAARDAAKLIDDPRLRDRPELALGLAAAYYVRGLARARIGERDGARADFEEALRRAPDLATARDELARLRG